jgi:molecular chaperone HtpG
MGIPMRYFKKIMTDVADSEKDRNTEKGFRGIGRLAGLGYCDTLIFRTSAKGENKESVITWDGVKLKEIVADPTQHPTSDQLIEMITDIQYVDAKEEEHFFEVIMNDVIFESDDLLDQEQVINYLQIVAPVPYANYFIFSSKIYEFAKNQGFKIDEYTILVNGNSLFKPYKTKLYEGTEGSKKEYDEIHDVEFKTFLGADGKPIAWMWYGIAKYEKYIPIVNTMRCIRLRKENIQIGDEDTLGYAKEYFKEPRGNGYFIGELFVVDNNLIPNARRDYFNPTPALKSFEQIVHDFFYSDLYDLYHYASKVRSAQKSLTNFEEKEKEFEEKVKNAGFIDSEEKEIAKKEIEESREKVAKAKRELENRRKDAANNEVLGKVFTEIEKTYKNDGSKETGRPKKDDKSENTEKNNKYLTQSLSKFGKKEQKLIAKIYVIIKSMLPKDMAEMVVKKIQEELSK